MTGNQVGTIKTAKRVFFGLFVVLFIGIAVLGAYNQGVGEQTSNVQSTSLDSLGSTNPSSPTYLYDDSVLADSYASSTYYYYRTSSSASSSYYHVVWLKPPSGYDFDLTLFSDSSYSTQIATSSYGGSVLDWIVFRPSSSQYYYPRGYAYSGSGSCYIEWESSVNSLSLGSSYSCVVSSTDYIEIYMIYLNYGSTYAFNLDNPTGGDYDLYVYYLNGGAAGAGASSYVAASVNSGTGYDELIAAYTPSTTGYYAVAVKYNSGSGTAYLSASYSSTSVTVLSDDSAVYQYYNAGSSYYFQTGSASSSYYHVVWLQPSDFYNDFNLYLYSDGSYSTLRASSTRGSGYLDWVVFYPSSSQYYYPRSYAYSGSGYGYIEWEDSSGSLSTGSSYQVSLSSSECIEIYSIYLSYGSTYSFTLDVPSTGDYDLYLYYLSSGSATSYSGYTRASTNSGTGVDEAISSFSPSYSAYYAVIVAWRSGSGTSYLLASTSGSVSYTSLSEESALYQSYSSSTYYNYQTGYAYSGYYHVIWVQPTSSSASDNLYLYSDSSFNHQIAQSSSGSGALNWVAFRPSGSYTYYYPRVYSYSGGNAYIEWERCTESLVIGGSTYGSLSSSECIEIYTAYLQSSKAYTITLDTPSSGDYDLYLYRLSYGGAASDFGYSACSTAYGSGVDEDISNFKPSNNDNYLIIVARKSGSGSFTLEIKEVFSMSPGAIFFVVFGIIATIGISAGVYKKYSGQRPRQPQRTVPMTPQTYKPVPQKYEPPKYIVQKLPQYLICVYCQSKNDLNDLFCHECGSEL